MKSKFTALVALLVLIVIVAGSSSCGTTTYRKKRYNSPKYIDHKRHWFKWHEHHYRPRQHRGGYW